MHNETVKVVIFTSHQVEKDLGTEMPTTYAIAQNPSTKNARPNPKTPTSKPQTHKTVAFDTLVFCPWHSDRIPLERDCG